MFNSREEVFPRHGDMPGTWALLHRDRAAMATGTMLLSVVAVLILVDVILTMASAGGSEGGLAHRLYIILSIGRDGSIAEMVNHGMAFSAAILFFAAAAATGSRVCLGLAVFMAIAWFDDAAQYHERVGRAFGQRYSDVEAFGVGAVHIGELVAWGTIGIVLLGLILWAWRHVLPGDRTVLRTVLVPVLLLVICATVIDVIHVIFSDSGLDLAFMYLEDGGEMIAMALMATVALYLVRNTEGVFGRA